MKGKEEKIEHLIGFTIWHDFDDKLACLGWFEVVSKTFPVFWQPGPTGAVTANAGTTGSLDFLEEGNLGSFTEFIFIHARSLWNPVISH